MSPSDDAGAILTIDLDALSRNYDRLRKEVAPAECAAVVKADGYGLGMGPVAEALARAGCESFFVATLDEGIELGGLLPGARIGVFNGPGANEAEAFAEHGLMPVLNDPGQIEAWRKLAARRALGPAALQVDTGMNRLGLAADEVERLAQEPERVKGIRFAHIMSHLACADEADNPMNAEQRALFVETRERLKALLGDPPASLANSSGIFLGPDYHFDMARPGVALYGVNPTPGRPNPMAEVVRLQGKIIQLREIDRAMAVGYGASHPVAPGERIATVSVGYADGFPRSLSNHTYGFIGTTRVPLVGHVSMDLITLDVSAVPLADARPGTLVTLIGGEHPIDAVAAEAGTIGYEILTSLGRHARRRYLPRA